MTIVGDSESLERTMIADGAIELVPLELHEIGHVAELAARHHRRGARVGSAALRAVRQLLGSAALAWETGAGMSWLAKEAGNAEPIALVLLSRGERVGDPSWLTGMPFTATRAQGVRIMRLAARQAEAVVVYVPCGNEDAIAVAEELGLPWLVEKPAPRLANDGAFLSRQLWRATPHAAVETLR